MVPSVRPPIFDGAENQRLVNFVTRDARTRSLTWEAICLEMGQEWGYRGLQACLKAAWESIPQERLDGLIRSIPARLQAVIDAEEGATPC